MANTIQVKRGAYASIPTLSAGEFGFSTDATKRLHIGDGAANHEVLLYDHFDAGTFQYATNDNTPEAKTRAEVMALLSGQASADFAMNSNKITGVTDPTAAQDAATKSYVDALVQGLKVHNAVACATTGNITLSGEQTLDGIVTSTSRVLVKDQTNTEENGIYDSAAGAWSRVDDMNADDEVAGSFVFISGGTTLGSTGWACTVDPDGYTIGTDAMPWAQFSSTGYVTASSGLTKTGNDIAPDGVLEDLNTLGTVASDGQVIVGTGAGAFAYESGATLRTSLGLAIGTDVLAEQTIGIADDNLVEVDGTPVNNDFAKFTANGLEGRSYSEVRTDLGLVIGTDVLAEQTIGIANDNLVEVDGTPVNGEAAVFTANGLNSLSEAEFKSTFNMEAGTDFQAYDAELAALAGLTSAANKIPYFTDSETASLLDFKDEDDMASDSATALASQQSIKKYVDDSVATADDFVELSDTPANFTDDGLKVLRVNTGETAVEFVSFASTYLEASPTNGETDKAPNSDWAYDHDVATTGVHGAGGNTLLHSGSTIDGGSYA